MAKPYITTKFDEDVQEYSKETGSSTGKNSQDDSSFKDTVSEYLKSVKDGSFLSGGLKKINLATKLLDKLKKVLGIDFDALKKLKSNLIEKLKDKNLPFLSSTGLNAVLKLITVSEKIFGKLAQQILGAVLSKVFIPDPVYLASLIAYDLAGADLEANDGYIRKLIIKRDITVALKWWNEQWGIEYSGLPSDRYTADAIISAQYGCFKNVEYILGEFKKSRNTLLDTLKTIPEVVKTNNMSEVDRKNYNMRIMIAQYAEDIYAIMAYVVKELIVSSYSNFTADELRNILDKTGLQPSIFGLTDTRFGGRYAIKNYDIDKCAPYFRLDSLESLNTTNRSSRYRRKYMKEHGGSLPPRKSSLLNMINPRNRNIKRLYLTLVSKNYESPMYNPDLAKRLQYKIANLFVKSLSGIDLIPSRYFKTQEDLWNSAYDYTVTIQDLLFNPATVSDLKLADTDIIKMPEEIKTAVVFENKNSIKVNDNDRRITIFNTIGPSLVIDGIKRDINVYMDQPFIEKPIYDNLGNRIIRDGNGGFILADINGNPVLDDENNTIPIDPILIPPVPRDVRNPKTVIPTNLEEYIKKLVDNYLTLNVKELIESTLLKIKTEDILTNTTDAIERISYDYFIQSGGIFFNEINISQVMVIVINNIQNGTISPTVLNEKPLSQLLLETVTELKNNDTYIPTFNGEDVINKVKLSISLLQDNIDKIKDGTLLPANIPTFTQIQSEADTLDSKGVISYLGSIDGINSATEKYDKISNYGNFSDAVFLAIQYLNNNIIQAYNQNKEFITYLELIGSFSSFNEIIKYYEKNLTEISVTEERKLLKEQIVILVDDIIKDNISIYDNVNDIITFPTFGEISKKALDSNLDKYDLSEVMDVLKDFGVDVNGYDIMSYYRGLDKMMNESKDEKLYDFDVLNPPKDVIISLEDEYSNRMKFKNKYYIWVNNI